ncbi:MAG: GNAT family N-acetyltransferase [Lachnospiraceae bacterium]|nr:GNAT family N-acetyltransferase [Lachnospiraceae bacterium]
MKKLFSEVPFLNGERLTLKRIEKTDADSLLELTGDPMVYRYLPTFLFEKKYPDIHEVIGKLYTECFQESIILGVYLDDALCGLAEMYGFRDEIHKISVGYRIMQKYWGRGITSGALEMLIRYLYDETDIEIITASTMVENHASARVLMKNGFSLVVSCVDEDWGYPQPTIADKWIR